MKRSLRTAEERKSTEWDDFYYYGTNPKKLMCSNEIDSNMENSFRRPLSDLKFMRPSQNEKSKEKKSHLKPCNGPRSRNKAELNKPGPNEASVKFREPNLENESVKGIDQNPGYDAPTGIAAFNELSLSEPVLTEPNEISVNILEPNVEDESVNGIKQNPGCEEPTGSAAFNELSLPEAVLTEPIGPNEISLNILEPNVEDRSVKGVDPNSGFDAPTGSTNDSFREINKNSVADAATMTVEYKCCCNDVLKMIDHREGRLIQKIQGIVTEKLNEFTLSLQESGALAESGADVDEEGTMSQNKTGSGTHRTKNRQSVIPVFNFGGDVVTFPFDHTHEANDLNLKLEDKLVLSAMVLHVVPFGGKGQKATLKIFNGIFSKDLRANFNWDNKGVSIQTLPNILSLVHEAGKKIHNNYNEKATNEMIKNTLRNARAQKN